MLTNVTIQMTKEHLRDAREREGVACIPHPLLAVDCAFKVVVTNLLPDLLSEEKFNEVIYIDVRFVLPRWNSISSRYERKSSARLKVLTVSITSGSSPGCFTVEWRLSW